MESAFDAVTSMVRQRCRWRRWVQQPEVSGEIRAGAMHLGIGSIQTGPKSSDRPEANVSREKTTEDQVPEH